MRGGRPCWDGSSPRHTLTQVVVSGCGQPWHVARNVLRTMRMVSAHDLRTGAAFVLLGSVSCVPARPEHVRHEVDMTIARERLCDDELKSIGSCAPGSFVYVPWGSDRWVKVRVDHSPMASRPS